jgi:hypothetical protein
MASIFHTMSHIANQLIPSKLMPPTKQIMATNNGIATIECVTYKLICFESYTGVKFLLTCDLSVENSRAEAKLKEIYKIYADFVCKNPFYDQNAQIGYALFENAINALFANNK